MTGVGPRVRSTKSSAVFGAFVPLAIAGLSYVLGWVGDRLIDVGPFDRAAFGWFVVIPTWIAAPGAAGYVWRGLDRRTTRAIAAFVGTVIAVVAALLIWWAMAFPACETGAVHTSTEMVLPSLIFGLVVGGGVALSGLEAVRFARQGRLIATLVYGAIAELLMGGAAILVFIVVFASSILVSVCQRPSV